MSDIIFYTEANYQGNSVTIPNKGIVAIFDENWIFRSAKLNGNKLYTTVNFASFDPVDMQDIYLNEDVADFTTVIPDTSNVNTITSMNLLSNDIIVSMDISVDLAGYCAVGVSAIGLATGKCYYQYTPEKIPGTFAVMNPDTMTTVTAALTAETRPIRIADKLTNMTLVTSANIELTYDNTTKNLSLTCDNKYITAAIEKFDDAHFIIHFDYVPAGDIHVCYYKGEEYRGDIDVQIENSLAEFRDSNGDFIYNSATLISNVNYPFYWAQTSYMKGDANYDFNTYKSQIFTSNPSDLSAIFDKTTSNAVRSIVSAGVIPVFLRPVNAAAQDAWQDFVIESSFTTSHLVQISSGKPTEYYAFCSNNPANTQPGMMCIASYRDELQDFRTCSLRYGVLDETGSTATWQGTATLNIDYASTDALTLSLGDDAPADWKITAITRGADGWYVDLSGSATA